MIVRPLEGTTDEYEIISGHRRFRAAQKVGLTEVPAFIRPVSRDEAAIMLVDSNLHREHILPSEKAFAYKMKYEALRHQGTSSQLGTKLRTDELLAQESGESRNQIQRYIRLTKLIPKILNMVDEQRIAFSVGVELSYLTEYEQQILLEVIELEDKTPSLSQAIQMKKLSQAGTLDSETIGRIVSEEKPNQREKISFQLDELSKYFPEKYTSQDIYKRMLKLAQDDYRRRQRNREER
ncbi:MAG: ParB/RepB/Spo0J family partition protein [Ruminococcus sp.]